MRTFYVPKKVKEKGITGSLLKLEDIPQFPSETLLLVKKTAEDVGNTDVLSYGLNGAMSSFYGNIGAYKMDYQKALHILKVLIENVCVLHCPELKVSAVHMHGELQKLKITSKRESLLEADADTLAFAHRYVSLASCWRENGGRNSWKTDSKTLKYILDHHGDSMAQVHEAIKATRSIHAPFIAAMDSVATPLALGAL